MDQPGMNPPRKLASLMSTTNPSLFGGPSGLLPLAESSASSADDRLDDDNTLRTPCASAIRSMDLKIIESSIIQSRKCLEKGGGPSKCQTREPLYVLLREQRIEQHKIRERCIEKMVREESIRRFARASELIL